MGVSPFGLVIKLMDQLVAFGETATKLKKAMHNNDILSQQKQVETNIFVAGLAETSIKLF